MAAAALAYKCMEVAYMRVVYCKNSSTCRFLHDLQTSLPSALQGIISFMLFVIFFCCMVIVNRWPDHFCCSTLLKSLIYCSLTSLFSWLIELSLGESPSRKECSLPLPLPLSLPLSPIFRLLTTDIDLVELFYFDKIYPELPSLMQFR